MYQLTTALIPLRIRQRAHHLAHRLTAAGVQNQTPAGQTRAPSMRHVLNEAILAGLAVVDLRAFAREQNQGPSSPASIRSDVVQAVADRMASEAYVPGWTRARLYREAARAGMDLLEAAAREAGVPGVFDGKDFFEGPVR